MSLHHSLNTTALKARLRQDRRQLIVRIREQLHRSGDPELISLANHMAGVDDWQVADLLLDTDIAILGHELAELCETDLALQRIDEGMYGICVECARPIEPARLNARPAALQCLACKTAFERRRGIFLNTAL